MSPDGQKRDDVTVAEIPTSRGVSRDVRESGPCQPGGLDHGFLATPHQIAAGGHRVHQFRHDAVRILGVGDQVQSW